jgi:hypothetical protein
MLLKSLSAGFVSLIVAGACWGQEAPTPGPEHERLKKLVGEWNAEMDAGGQKSQAAATYKSICNGMWLSSDFEGDFGGFKFQGHGMDGYDLNKKKYVAIWVDSMQSAPLTMEGDYDEKTKTMTMTGESRGPGGTPQKVKTTTETKDDDHFTFKMYMVDGDGKEQHVFTIEYSRKK